MAAMYKEHKFWDTQPVPNKSNMGKLEPGKILETQDVKTIQKTPYTLAEGFEWTNVDLKDDA